MRFIECKRPDGRILWLEISSIVAIEADAPDYAIVYMAGRQSVGIAESAASFLARLENAQPL